MTATRRLAAILAADVVGYSRLLGADEAATLTRLRSLRREVIDPLLSEHNGRIFKTTGDGLLAEFPSAVQALRCAIAIQDHVRADPAALQLRIGLHQGDVVIEGDDLLGDGVNIAARIEPLAEPGGICISARVREDAAGKISINVEDLGEPELKNIAQKVRVFRLRLATESKPQLALPDKPSLVVLPFQNMSGDPEQEYFVDGLVEDITTALSSIRSLFVIARNSAFTYKGRAVDVRQVGRELGVRYVLEGSVRRAGPRLRITGQLVDAITGAHLWANRFDGALADVFDLQDQITSNVAGAIEPHLQRAEIERAQRKPTNDLGAYDYYLRAMGTLQRGGSALAAEAQALFAKAYGLDPDYAAAYGWWAFCAYWRKNDNLVAATAPEIAEGVRLARLAATKGWDDPVALTCAGRALAYLSGDLDAGAALTERACALNPNSAFAWGNAAWSDLACGDPEAAIAKFERALRLSPADPFRLNFTVGIARTHFNAGRYDDAIALCERALSEQPGQLTSHRLRVAAYAMAGRTDLARRALADLLADQPDMRLSKVVGFKENWRRLDDHTRWFEGLRAAGMPE